MALPSSPGGGAGRAGPQSSVLEEEWREIKAAPLICSSFVLHLFHHVQLHSSRLLNHTLSAGRLTLLLTSAGGQTGIWTLIRAIEEVSVILWSREIFDPDSAARWHWSAPDICRHAKLSSAVWSAVCFPFCSSARLSHGGLPSRCSREQAAFTFFPGWRSHSQMFMLSSAVALLLLSFSHGSASGHGSSAPHRDRVWRGRLSQT